MAEYADVKKDAVQRVDYIQLTADIISAYVAKTSVPQSELSKLIMEVYRALAGASSPGSVNSLPVDAKPAVSVKKSVTNDYIICLEDGKKFKSLKRHLRSQYNLSPEQYRERWGLPADYPMVAPSYAQTRSNLAKRIGLGRKRGRK